MTIYTLDGLNGINGLIEVYSSVVWNVQFYGMNDFELVVNGTEENIERLTEGTLLCRDKDISGGTYKNVMVIEKIKFSYDAEKGYTMTITGRGLKSILARRLVWNQITRSGSVEDTIRKAVNDNAVDPNSDARAIPGLVMASAHGYTPEDDIQLFGENLAEWLSTACQTYGFGWDVYIAGGHYVFDLFEGVDRSTQQSDVPPVIFAPSFDNLITCDYEYNKENFANAALVGGEGEGTAKRCSAVGTAEGLERFEVYVDGGEVSSNGEIITEETYKNLLKQYGKEELAKLSFTETFEADINTNGIYKMGVDYFLGDIVQVETERGISARSRLIEIWQSADDNGQSEVGIFSEWEVN